MRILVTNDDSIHSPGLWGLAEALTDVGQVCVVAPDRDQSGIGTAMTLLTVLRVHPIASPVEGVEAFAVQGTPADAVILATESLSAEPFDLVVSGINHGANMGLDVISSGTVGAALQGYRRGIPSIAVSVASLIDVQFDVASTTARAMARGISRLDLEATLLLNVNVPNVALEKIEQVEITRPGPRAYLANVERVQEGRRTHYWIRHDRPAVEQADEGTDIWAVRNHRVSITPIDLMATGGAPDAVIQALADEVRADLGLG